MKLPPTLLVVTALLAGCNPAEAPAKQERHRVTPKIRITEAHNGIRFKIPRGAELEVRLDTNDDPRHMWKVSALPPHLIEIGYDLQSKDGMDPRVGGTEVYSFRTKGAGHGRLELQDIADGATRPSRTFAIEIDAD